MHSDTPKRLGFELLGKSTAPYILQFEKASGTPTLDIYVAKGDPKTGKPFAERDLTPARVSFNGRVLDGIRCSPMTWAQHLWSNRPDVRKSLPVGERLEALSICVLVETSDGMFPIIRRSMNVALLPGYWHISAGGYVDLKKAEGSQSPLPSVFAELHEELNLLPADIESVHQLGLCRHLTPSIAVVEVCFYVKATLSANDVLAAAASARDKYEGKYHLRARSEPGNMVGHEKFNPAGAATTILALGL